MVERQWKSLEELAALMVKRASRGKTVTLSPTTAKLVAIALRPRETPESRYHVDLYSQGSTVYAMDHRGEVEQIDAWARSTSVGRAAYEALKMQYPNREFMMRRGAWIEADTKEDKEVAARKAARDIAVENG